LLRFIICLELLIFIIHGLQVAEQRTVWLVCFELSRGDGMAHDPHRERFVVVWVIIKRELCTLFTNFLDSEAFNWGLEIPFILEFSH